MAGRNYVTDGVTTSRSPIGQNTSSEEASKLQQRLRTYTNWHGKKTALQLAAAGFVYTGIADKVECDTCHIRLYNWQTDEDPIQVHKKYAPDCDFMLTNYPQIKVPAPPKAPLPVKYPQYSTYQSRLDTFQDWPLKCVAQKPEMMAKSGFFYFGSADRARCFHCGVTLRDFDTDDYPPSAHKQWSQHCPFVQTLDIADLTEQIEEWERQEKMRIDFENSKFFDCSSSLRAKGVVVTDGGGVTSRGDNSQPDSHLTTISPAFQALVEMGYPEKVIFKAAEVRRKEGCINPDATSLLEVILDMET